MSGCLSEPHSRTASHTASHCGAVGLCPASWGTALPMERHPHLSRHVSGRQ